MKVETVTNKGPPCIKKKYTQKFRSDWLKDSRFSSWISPCEENETEAFCTLCHQKITGSVTFIERHRNTRKHMKQVMSSTPVLVSKTCKSINKRYETPENISAEEISADSYDEADSMNATVSHPEFRSPLSLRLATQSLPKKGSAPNTSLHTESSHEVNTKLEEDPIDLFAQFITAQMRRLPEEHAINLTLEIHGLIAKKLVKALSDKDTHRNTGDSPQVITVSIDKELFRK